MRFFELLSGCVKKSEFHFLGKMDKYTYYILSRKAIHRNQILFNSIKTFHGIQKKLN